MKTIDKKIEEMENAIKDPSTWKDERSCLRAEVMELKAIRKAAKANATLLLAVVKDLAYGANAGFLDKVANARNVLRDHEMATIEEYALNLKGNPEVTPGVKFYDKW